MGPRRLAVAARHETQSISWKKSDDSDMKPGGEPADGETKFVTVADDMKDR